MNGIAKRNIFTFSNSRHTHKLIVIQYCLKHNIFAMFIIRIKNGIFET